MKKTNILYLDQCKTTLSEKYLSLFQKDKEGKLFVKIDEIFDKLQYPYEWIYGITDIDYVGWQIEQGVFDWKKYSWVVAKYSPQNFDSNKYDWEEHSWAITAYAPQFFDPNKFNWKKNSVGVACLHPEFFDAEKYNWEEASWAVAQYCPHLLDPKKYNWRAKTFVELFCPQYLNLR